MILDNLKGRLEDFCMEEYRLNQIDEQEMNE